MMGVIYILLSLNALFLLKWPTEFTLSFFFAIFVFIYTFIYRDILLQQRAKGKKQDRRLLTQLYGLSLLLLILGFLYVSLWWVVHSSIEPH
jgi:4-hydroxybenzoate polyprenyltransferase